MTVLQLAAMLKSAGGDEILLGTGRPCCFLIAGGLRPITPAPLTTEQVVGVLGEVIPPEARTAVAAHGLADFHWTPTDLPPMDVHLEQRGDAVFARLRKAQAPQAPSPPPPAAPQPAAAPAELGTARDLELDTGDGERLELEETIEEIQPEASLRAVAVAPPPVAPKPAAPPPMAVPLVAAVTGSPDSGREILALLKLLTTNGSDLHIAVGSPPRIRQHGVMLALQYRVMSAADLEGMLDAILAASQMRRFRDEMALDFSFTLPNVGRFRANACIERKGIRLTFRAVPASLPSIAQLGLPASVEGLTNFPNGLILVTGPAGCGKTTTQAAIINRINETWKDHIVTVEDPIEYVHPPKSCLVSQREVGTHVRSFAEALKSALREDPDVILVGELRDLETIQLAITAAETGHLVLGTLHTINAAHTIDRLIDVFPGRQKSQIRGMVAESLRGVISQQLVRTADGKSRVAAFEVLLGDRSIANLIREAKTFQISNAIRLGRNKGMLSMDDSLLSLAKTGTITVAAALEHSESPDGIRKAFEKGGAQQNPPKPATQAAGQKK